MDRALSRMMIPLEGECLFDIVQIALHNISCFNTANFATWLVAHAATTGVAEIAALCRPDCLYRVMTDAERAGQAAPVVLGIVVGYVRALRGAPAMPLIQILGVKDGLGSFMTPMPVPADSLTDVTEEARLSKLKL